MKSLLILISTVLFVGNAWALKYDSSVPQNIQSQMQQDLDFMNQIQGEKQTELHKQIYGGVNGADYKKFFETRITAIGMNPCGNGNAVACVIPLFNPHKMWLTKNFVNFSHPQVARAMVIYHEARHSETKNGNWSHDTCPTPFVDETGAEITSIWTGAKLAGEPACDSTAFGSYGSSTIMLKNIAKFCTNCADKVKMDADLYSTDQLKRIDKPEVKTQMLNDFAIQ